MIDKAFWLKVSDEWVIDDGDVPIPPLPPPPLPYGGEDKESNDEIKEILADLGLD